MHDLDQFLPDFTERGRILIAFDRTVIWLIRWVWASRKAQTFGGWNQNWRIVSQGSGRRATTRDVLRNLNCRVDGMGHISKDQVVLAGSEWENWVAEVAQVFVIFGQSVGAGIWRTWTEIRVLIVLFVDETKAFEVIAVFLLEEIAAD